jgi:cytochrome c553
MTRILRIVLALAAAVAFAISANAQSKTQPKDPEDAPELYPAHPRRDDAFYACVACHSFKLVAQQGMSRARWDDSITWMTERHKMPKLEGKDREAVLDYLSTVFPERTQPGGWKSPFSPQ